MRVENLVKQVTVEVISKIVSPLLLSPGEFVFKRKIAEAIGYDRLNEINALQPGSVTQKKLDDVAMLNTKVRRIKKNYYC